MKNALSLTKVLTLLATLALLQENIARADTNFVALVQDRIAIEHVYFNHRLGNQQSFEQAVTREVVEQLVRQDLLKEAALEKCYGIEITATQIDSEVQRIDASTRAPEVLAELKAALDNDPKRFVQTVVKPILVERLLRDHFENDAQLHSVERLKAEDLRRRLLSAKRNNASASELHRLLQESCPKSVTETTWQLEKLPENLSGTESPDATESEKHFGPKARLISQPTSTERGLYFEDLPASLRQVLAVQLQRAGDLSAVIETPGGFLLYLATERNERSLSVATLALPKLNYEQWLVEQCASISPRPADLPPNHRP
jgi:hypothetical protein